MKIVLKNKPEYSIYESDDVCTFAYKSKTMERGYSDEVHTYDALKIVRVTDGSGIWNINGTDFSVSRDDLIVLGSHDVRFVKDVTCGEALKIEQVEFMPITLYPWQACADFFFRASAKKRNILSRDSIHHKRILDGFDAIREEVAANERSKNAYITQLLIGMVISASRIVSPTGESASILTNNQYDIVCDAIRYINNHFANDLSRECLAKKYYISPSHFSRIFKEYSGVCLQEYIMCCRVSGAIRLLETTDRAVLDIAFECGFSSSSGFYKAMKKITGKTPQDFRKK